MTALWSFRVPLPPFLSPWKVCKNMRNSVCTKTLPHDVHLLHQGGLSGFLDRNRKCLGEMELRCGSGWNTARQGSLALAPPHPLLSLWFVIHSVTTEGTRWDRDDLQLSSLKTGLLVTGNCGSPSSLQSQKADLARPASSHGESAADKMPVAWKHMDEKHPKSFEAHFIHSPQVFSEPGAALELNTLVSFLVHSPLSSWYPERWVQKFSPHGFCEDSTWDRAYKVFGASAHRESSMAIGGKSLFHWEVSDCQWCEWFSLGVRTQRVSLAWKEKLTISQLLLWLCSY